MASTPTAGFYRDRLVCIAGGASFIGSHLAERLVAAGARVTIVDDFSSGTRENLSGLDDDVRIVPGDLRDVQFGTGALQGAELVFHLAASRAHRGR